MTATAHTLVVTKVLHTGKLRAAIEHEGPITDRCHGWDPCKTCSDELRNDDQAGTAYDRITETIFDDKPVHGVEHHWWDGEAYVLADTPRCYVLDWQAADVLDDELERLVVDEHLTAGRYRIASWTLTEDECEIELDPADLRDPATPARESTPTPVPHCDGQLTL